MAEMVDDRTYRAMRHTCRRTTAIERNGLLIKVDRLEPRYFIPDPNCAKCVQKDLRSRRDLGFEGEPIRPGVHALSLSERDGDPGASRR